MLKQKIIFCFILTACTVMSEICTDWTDTLTYLAGSKVKYNGKAYKALTLIWDLIPPMYSNHWEEIPINECEACSLQIDMHYAGNIIVDTLADGSSRIFSWHDGHTVVLEYASGSVVNLTGEGRRLYDFDFWDLPDQDLYENPVTITINSNMEVDPIFKPCYELEIFEFYSSIITINPNPEGVSQTFDGDSIFSVAMKYDLLGKYIITTSIVAKQWWQFNYWENDSNTNPVRVDTLDSINFYISLIPCVTHQRYDLGIFLNSNGSVTIDKTPYDTIITVDQNSGDMVTFKYMGGDTVHLIANPEPGYKLVDWGDPAQTTMNSIHLLFDHDIILSPTYEPVSNEFKIPSQTDDGDNMVVQGLSQFHGLVQDYNDLSVVGKLIVKDSIPNCDSVELSYDNISVGNTNLFRDSVYSDSLIVDHVWADTCEVKGSLILEKYNTNRLEVTATNFPDYVFNDSYFLKPLPEIKEEIKKKGHLSGIPSEEEVKNKGFDLSEIYVKLLEKCEEMTLHIIKLKNRINMLKSQKSND